MAARGVHFALSNRQYSAVGSCKSDLELISFIQEDIEEEWDKEWLYESDKAWDAIHRCLTDGNLEWANGQYPLNAVILGGKQLYEGDSYIISITTPEQVAEIADALIEIDKTKLKAGYEKIVQANYDGELGVDDFDYTWEYFQEFPNFYRKASNAGRAMIFTVDQ